MWSLRILMDFCSTYHTEINGKWVPARPLNHTRKYASFKDRLKRAWKVFRCEADCFMWPENQ